MTPHNTALRGHKLFRDRDTIAATAPVLGHTLELEPHVHAARSHTRAGNRPDLDARP